MKKISIIIILFTNFGWSVSAKETLKIKHKIEKLKNTEVHIFEIPSDHFLIRPVKALNVGVGRETVSNMAKRAGATLAINGTFFTAFPEYEGIPSGVYKLKDEWLSIGDKSRAALGIKNNELFWGRLKVSAFAKVGDKVYEIHGINRPPKHQENILYTESFNRSTLTHKDRLEMILSDGQIASIHQRGDTNIPCNGCVLSLPYQRIPASFGPGTKAQITYTTEADSESTPWKEMDFIVSGAPLLLHNGKLITDYKTEDIQNQFVEEKFARTAIGSKADGSIVVVVAGRIPTFNGETLKTMPLEEIGYALLEMGYSRFDVKKMTLDEILLALKKCEKNEKEKGFTIPELGEFMQSLGVVNAINLSGGNSTNVFFEGQNVRMGSSTPKEEKKVADSITFIDKETL